MIRWMKHLSKIKPHEVWIVFVEILKQVRAKIITFHQFTRNRIRTIAIRNRYGTLGLRKSWSLGRLMPIPPLRSCDDYFFSVSTLKRNIVLRYSIFFRFSNQNDL